MIPRAPDACWRILVDAAQLPAWVPGLRKARVVAWEPSGLPSEILFEYSASLTYSLTYSYSVEDREIRWEPRTGKRDGVRGFARLDACEGGTQLTYGLEQGSGRTAADLELADVEALTKAFSSWVESRVQGLVMSTV